MAQVSIFWDPQGHEVDSLGSKRYLRATDGDTPYVSMPIRMLSIDTPEVHYPGRTRPSKYNENLAQLAQWIQQGKTPVPDGLAAHLRPKLATGRAGTLQEQQGKDATKAFEDLLEQKLTRPNGRKARSFSELLMNISIIMAASSHTWPPISLPRSGKLFLGRTAPLSTF